MRSPRTDGERGAGDGEERERHSRRCRGGSPTVLGDEGEQGRLQRRRRAPAQHVALEFFTAGAAAERRSWSSWQSPQYVELFRPKSHAGLGAGPALARLALDLVIGLRRPLNVSFQFLELFLVLLDGAFAGDPWRPPRRSNAFCCSSCSALVRSPFLERLGGALRVLGALGARGGEDGRVPCRGWPRTTSALVGHPSRTASCPELTFAAFDQGPCS